VNKGSIRQQISLLTNLGNLRRRASDLVEAERLYARALNLAEQSGNADSQAILHRNIGDLMSQEKNYSSATRHLMAALTHYRASGQKRRIVGCLAELAENHVGEGEWALAGERIEEAERQAGEMEYAADLIQKIAVIKCEVLEQQGDYRQALRECKRYFDLYAKRQTRVTESKVRELNVRYELERRERDLRGLKLEQELAALEARAGRDRLHLLVILLCGLTAVIGLGALLIRGKLRAERREHEMTSQARESAESSANLKTRLLRMAAHDLRSPLTVILSSADLIGELAEDVKTTREYARHIRDAAGQMNLFLDGLLTQAVAEQSTLVTELAPLDLREQVQAIVAYLRILLSRKQQRLEFVDEAGVPSLVLADSVKMWQVLENLVTNASKFSPAESTVSVLLEKRGKMLVCGVRDEGPGISSDEKRKLFRPFMRGRARPTGGESSTGLGLSIVKEIMDHHGGQVWVESEPGQGATFWFSLPCWEDKDHPTV
jgi:signal transduction histidine kinase